VADVRIREAGRPLLVLAPLFATDDRGATRVDLGGATGGEFDDLRYVYDRVSVTP